MGVIIRRRPASTALAARLGVAGGVLALALYSAWLYSVPHWEPRTLNEKPRSTCPTSPPPKAAQQFPWDKRMVRRRVCHDSCPTARNGACDEGRVGTSGVVAPDSFQVTCDLGTDCTDCGAWEFHGPKAALKWTPVQNIVSKRLSINARAAAFQLDSPSFMMPYSDPDHDVDVSNHVHHGGMIEPGLTAIWYKILSANCHETEGGRAPLVVDVGANFGWFTFMSASMGCRVVAWEPVPHFAAFLKWGLLRNNLTALVEVRETIVSDQQGGQLTMVVPNRGIWGTAGIGGANIDTGIQNEGEYDQVVKATERVDAVVQEDVLIMKADVEGFEWMVLHGACHLFHTHQVSHFIFEYSPGVAERQGDWQAFKENPLMLIDLLNLGFTVLHVRDAHGTIRPWDDPLPLLEAVTAQVLQHDVLDADRLAQGTLGCPLPDELEHSDSFYRCNSLPEALSPHSFRSTFGHNTNVWAFKGAAPPYAVVGPPASLFPLEYDLTTNFFTPHDLGAARRPCEALTPQNAVAHRCSCPDKAVCGEMEELVTRLARAGRLAPQ